MKRIKWILALSLVLSMLTGCTHKHKFSEPTCEKAATCEECGKVKGEKLEHDLTEATCDKPSQCKNCTYVAEKKLGHTVEFGICDVCGKTVGEYEFGKFCEEVISILEVLVKIDEHKARVSETEEVKNANSREAVLILARELNPLLVNLYGRLEKVRDLCYDYESLASIKKGLEESIAKFDSTFKYDTYAEARKSLQGMMDGVTRFHEVYVEIDEFCLNCMKIYGWELEG